MYAVYTRNWTFHRFYPIGYYGLICACSTWGYYSFPSLPPNFRTFTKRKIHALPTKNWDDCTEFIPSVMFMIPYNCNHVSFFDKLINMPIKDYIQTKRVNLKGVFAKNERGYRHTAKNKRFWSLLILLLSVASIRRKLFKTTYAE